MSEVNAWQLDLGEGLLAAVGELEMVHVLPDEPDMFEIPQSPFYCRNVLIWQEEILPIMNLAARLLGRPVAETQDLVAITAFQEYPGAETRHGALILHSPPARIRVNDSHACNLPDGQPDWQRLALACFEHSISGPVPVLNLAKVFSTPQGGTDERVGQGPTPSVIYQLESNVREPRHFNGEKA